MFRFVSLKSDKLVVTILDEASFLIFLDKASCVTILDEASFVIFLDEASFHHDYIPRGYIQSCYLDFYVFTFINYGRGGGGLWAGLFSNIFGQQG